MIAVVGRPSRIALYGTTLFTISTLACLVFFGPAIAARAILTLSVLDATAALGVRRFGRRRLYNGKSFVGPFFRFLSGASILLLRSDPLVAVLMAGAGSLAELMSPVDDNLAGPIVAAMAGFFSSSSRWPRTKGGDGPVP